jgi:hypothetical protein
MFGTGLRGCAFLSAGMSERRTHLQRLATRVANRSDIADAYTAKSFTDRLFVLEIEGGEGVPDEVVELLCAHDLLPAGEVYGDSDRQKPFAGPDDREQYRFVDTQSRGSLQSYVVS